MTSPHAHGGEYEMTSHETISHDDIGNLGYDWVRAADPDVAARRPLTVFFPENAEEVAEIVANHVLGATLRVRSRGHSSNDLVLGDRDVAILCTQYMNEILDFDGDAETVTVQCGVVLADLDAYLELRGFGLPVIGDHNHITAGGFASVGGVSPSSHLYGMFVDNVKSVEFVDRSGSRKECTSKDPVFARLLGGTGRFGVMTTLTLGVIPGTKTTTILRNDRRLTCSAEKFLRLSEKMVKSPGGAAMERGMWLDVPTPLGAVCVGQVSKYSGPAVSTWAKLRNRLSYAYLHFLGRWAGRLPRVLDRFVQFLGISGIIVTPRYASIKNIESFSDKVLDSSVGDPSRMFIVFPPADRYAVMYAEVYSLCRDYRESWGCFTFLGLYVKGIQSTYLSEACGKPDEKFSEIVLYLGVVPDRLRPVLDRFVSDLDQICVDHGGFRYMHTKTSGPDDERRVVIDPNEALEASRNK